jgi:serine/threonine protein kinase
LEVYAKKYCGGKMSEEKTRKIAIQIKKAFEVLRLNKVVHRDLKLANILVT